MTGRELGCKLNILIFSALAIFGFFGCLMDVADKDLRAAAYKKQQLDTNFDMNTLAAGLKAYAEKNGGKLPPMENPAVVKAALFPKFVAFDDVFTRLGDNAAHIPNPAVSGKKLAELPPATLVFAEPEPNQKLVKGKPQDYNRAALQADGTVVRLNRDQWKQRGWR